MTAGLGEEATIPEVPTFIVVTLEYGMGWHVYRVGAYKGNIYSAEATREDAPFPLIVIPREAIIAFHYDAEEAAEACKKAKEAEALFRPFWQEAVAMTERFACIMREAAYAAAQPINKAN